MKRILKMVICCSMCLATLSCSTVTPSTNQGDFADVSKYLVGKGDIPLRFQYDEQVPITSSEFEGEATWYSDVSWEKWSLPIGNGYMGANIFGRTETERIQISEKTMVNPHWFAEPHGICKGGLNNFSETFIDFGHTNSDVSNYTRYLDLKSAISGVEYMYNGVNYSREYFTSYPDKVLVVRLDADTEGALNFTLRPTIPYEQDYMEKAGDGLSKHGTVTSRVEDGVGHIELSGNMGYYDIDFFGVYKVYTNGGTVSAGTANHTYTDTAGKSHTDVDGTIVVKNATSAYIVLALGTDYELSSEMFTSPDDKKPTYYTSIDDAMIKVESDIENIEDKISNLSFEEGYKVLKDRHIKDYAELFGRVSLNLNCDESDFSLTTDELLSRYEKGEQSNYLEVLLYQYGRYLLIASSREGTLPSHLQGAWNTYNSPAWSSGYWHNINVQMNYWPAFSTNLSETFISYVEYCQAYMQAAENHASDAVSSIAPEKFGKDGGNGWTMGVAASPYFVNGDSSSGNLGYTTQLFWEYYAFTQDKEMLKEVVYPILYSAAQFITKIVVEDENGNYLVKWCDSPEQYVNGSWYYTSGTTYAQSFAYLNNYNLLLAAKELGIDLNNPDVLLKEENAVLQTVLEQIDKYDPIIVGLSGQIKEFREEQYYGDLGEWQHRHISHLVSLFPGNIINSNTPAWLDASKIVLIERGDTNESWGGWSIANKMSMWARIKDGNKAHTLLEILISESIAPNLWNLMDTQYNRLFQIDGNFGATAAMTELLLQSDAGYIDPLAALPDAWSDGSYTGLVARGNFEVSAAWENGSAKSINILSKSGGTATVSYPLISGATVRDENGKKVEFTVENNSLISFDTEVGKTYVIYNIKESTKLDAPSTLSCTGDSTNGFELCWDAVKGAKQYNVYIAMESQPDYTLFTTTSTNYVYIPADEIENVRMTFAVVAVDSNLIESDRTVCYYEPIKLVDGITIDGIRESLYGTSSITVSLDDNRNYTIYSVKTDEGVFIYSEGIFNTCANDVNKEAWSEKTNFEFRLNGGKQSYVNVLNQSFGTTYFAYDVKQTDDGKYKHVVEIFVSKDIIDNWSDSGNVRINYAWKTPGENAYMLSDMMDSRYADWNTDWHSYHKYGGLSTYYVSMPSNLFISKDGLVWD